MSNHNHRSKKARENHLPHKVVDPEFELKEQECRMVEKNIHNIQRLFRNFHRNTGGLKYFFEEIFATFGACYDNNSPFWPLVNEALSIHHQATLLYDVLAANVARIGQLADEWDKYFGEVRANLKNRHSLRHAHDHYNHKLGRLQRRRLNKQARGKVESERFQRYIQTNDIKYRGAVDEYVRVSSSAYQMMHEFLEYRAQIITPALAQLVEEESKFFEALAQLFSRLENFQQALSSVEGQIPQSNAAANYDPFKFIRGRNLLARTDIRSSFQGQTNVFDNKKSFLTQQIDTTYGFQYHPLLQSMKNYPDYSGMGQVGANQMQQMGGLSQTMPLNVGNARIVGITGGQMPIGGNYMQGPNQGQIGRVVMNENYIAPVNISDVTDKDFNWGNAQTYNQTLTLGNQINSVNTMPTPIPQQNQGQEPKVNVQVNVTNDTTPQTVQGNAGQNTDYAAYMQQYHSQTNQGNQNAMPIQARVVNYQHPEFQNVEIDNDLSVSVESDESDNEQIKNQYVSNQTTNNTNQQQQQPEDIKIKINIEDDRKPDFEINSAKSIDLHGENGNGENRFIKNSQFNQGLGLQQYQQQQPQYSTQNLQQLQQQPQYSSQNLKQSHISTMNLEEFQRLYPNHNIEQLQQQQPQFSTQNLQQLQQQPQYSSQNLKQSHISTMNLEEFQRLYPNHNFEQLQQQQPQYSNQSQQNFNSIEQNLPNNFNQAPENLVNHTNNIVPVQKYSNSMGMSFANPVQKQSSNMQLAQNLPQIRQSNSGLVGQNFNAPNIQQQANFNQIPGQNLHNEQVNNITPVQGNISQVTPNYLQVPQQGFSQTRPQTSHSNHSNQFNQQQQFENRNMIHPGQNNMQSGTSLSSLTSSQFTKMPTNNRSIPNQLGQSGNFGNQPNFQGQFHSGQGQVTPGQEQFQPNPFSGPHGGQPGFNPNDMSRQSMRGQSNPNQNFPPQNFNPNFQQ